LEFPKGNAGWQKVLKFGGDLKKRKIEIPNQFQTFDELSDLFSLHCLDFECPEVICAAD
jgi:hypothetical protein